MKIWRWIKARNSIGNVPVVCKKCGWFLEAEIFVRWDEYRGHAWAEEVKYACPSGSIGHTKIYEATIFKPSIHLAVEYLNLKDLEYKVTGFDYP